MNSDTIGAISTPPGNGGIGIIRVSGPAAIETVDAIFASCRQNSETYNIRTAHEVVRMSAFTMKHGYIFDPDTDNGAGVPEFADECLVSVMRAPRSYTGEDVVEVNTHGGTAVMRRVLGILFKRGVRPAEPGEFTKRAFLNGRIDLTRAEAVAELIRARTEESRKAAMEQMTGALAALIDRHAERIGETLARLEVAIDYPEYDEDEQIIKEALDSLESTGRELRELAATYERGRLVREGLRVAISGRPNAGKSSLLNGLLGFGRAIVTDIPGTTRDTLEESMEIAGFPVILTDTAGLRDASDVVEQLGVERARAELERADVVIFMFDAGGNIDEDLRLLRSLAGETAGKHLILAVNKCDLLSPDALAAYKTRFEAEITPENAAETVYISVKQGGAAEISDRIAAYLERHGAGSGGAILTGERHKALVDKAIAAIDRATVSAGEGRPLDFIAYDVWECANALGEITGRNVTDEVVDTIFSKFCLGK
ncbi:MAG: tRNA uridine-5-carboxymethylaminomethyl(34) synthesis GTPase MnmE [Clostridia bacterium]|nr:tRNA uridine-5-carboxymethylaminomethyl(34) synthesis GTPase MnmE [Clostridia bacterium]